MATMTKTMTPTNRAFLQAVLGSLTDDLRKPKYRGHPNPLAGHCYVVAEVLKWHFGARWTPMQIGHENDSHWFLKNKDTGEILDPTAPQFKTPVPYKNARGRGFLTKELSKRARILLERVQQKLVKG